MSARSSLDLMVNFQGDAVLTPPGVLSALLASMREIRGFEIFTAAVRVNLPQYLEYVERKSGGDASGTFVVFSPGGRALYFSKAVIPFLRVPEEPLPAFRHVGIYGYRRSALRRYLDLDQCPLERVEGLEQLRALENGIPVHVTVVDYAGRTHAAVDKPGDVRMVEEIIEREGELVEFSGK